MAHPVLLRFDMSIWQVDIKDHFKCLSQSYQLALFRKKIKTNVQNFYIFTIDTPPGCPGVSTDPGETKRFNFLGSRCDHEALEQLEPKNLSKTTFSTNYGTFGRFLGPGRFKTPWLHSKPKNRIFRSLPDL